MGKQVSPRSPKATVKYLNRGHSPGFGEAAGMPHDATGRQSSELCAVRSQTHNPDMYTSVRVGYVLKVWRRPWRVGTAGVHQGCDQKIHTNEHLAVKHTTDDKELRHPIITLLVSRHSDPQTDHRKARRWYGNPLYTVQRDKPLINWRRTEKGGRLGSFEYN